MWAGNSQLLAVDTLLGKLRLTYRHRDPSTGRQLDETVEVLSQQTPAWVQNRGAGRAVELDALDAFTASAQAAVGPVVVTDHLATLPPPTAAQIATQVWIDKINLAQQYKAAKALGVSTPADDTALTALLADIKATFLPEYKQYLR
jgi:hypothetical protein